MKKKKKVIVPESVREHIMAHSTLDKLEKRVRKLEKENKELKETLALLYRSAGKKL